LDGFEFNGKVNERIIVPHRRKGLLGKIEVVFSNLSKVAINLKQIVVSRFYWGRGNLYKQTLQVSILVITVIIFLTGVTSRLFGLGDPTLVKAFNITQGNVDVLQQGSGLQAVLASDPTINFNIIEYVVKPGDTLQSIATKYNVSKDTIKWDNVTIFGSYDAYTSEKITEGEKLEIPEINGIIYVVKANDTLDSIVSKTKGDRFQIIEINQLIAPDYSVTSKKQIFIPNGSLPSPAAPVIYYAVSTHYTSNGIYTNNLGANQALNGVVFSNPLSDSSCKGYIWMRGFSSFHNGVDLAKGGGCPERAACSGKVTEAGWQNGGQGFNTVIDCGNGVSISYYHSNGDLALRAGDHVSQGQFVQFMGQSGFATGIHLHLGLRLNGQFIDPSPYIPY